MQFRWADFLLDLDARTLERGGAIVPVPARVFDLLALLLRNQGRLVSDAAIRRELWSGVSVSDASLRQLLKEARRAIGDDGRRQAQIETVRGRGVRWLVPVSTDTRADAAFVGRADVLAAVEREIEEVAAGCGGATLISGRAGIGKTSTLVEIAARAEARGFRVLEAWARTGSEAAPYSLWSDVAEALGAPALKEASGDFPASSGIAESNRFARFRGVEHAILRSARERPLLLGFDDLQFADRESLALLRFLAPALRHGRAWIVGTHRPLPAGDAQTGDLAALAADGATRVIELRGLHAAEVRAVVAAHLRASLGEGASGMLGLRTGGSPLLALEVARSLAAGGVSLAAVSAAEIEDSVALGLAPLLARRLAALSPASRRLLEVAATIGGAFDPELVSTVTGSPREELDRGLGEAERHGLIERQFERAWRFSHPLFAEAVASELAARGATPAVHRRIFDALEASGDADAFRLATHALGAGDRIDSAAAVAQLRLAAQAAGRTNALADAETWQRRAVELAESASLPAVELCDLHRELGEIALGSSSLIAARVAFERSAGLARATGDAVRLSRAALGYAHRTFLLASADPVLDWLRAAEASPSGDDSLEARVSARLGAELLISGRARNAEAEAMMRDGLARARQLGDPLTLGRVLCDVSIARFDSADVRGDLAAAQEIASCGRQAGDVEIEFRGLAAVATACLECGDRDGLDGAFEACERFTEQFPMPYARSVTQGMAAMHALLDGHLDAAAAAIAASERSIRGTGSLGLLMIVGLQRYALAREQGDVGRALPALEQARLRFPEQLGLSALAGIAHALIGNAELARDAADVVLARHAELPHDRGRAPTLAVVAELSSLVGSRPLAEALEPLLAPFSDRHAVTGNAAVYFGSLAHALGFVCAVQGRRREAIRHFEHALRAHEALRSPAWCNRSAEALARLRRPPSKVVKLVS